MATPLLEIRDLRVSFKADEGLIEAVRGVDLAVHKGEILGIVGESGCGKSVTWNAALRILPKTAITQGQVLLHAHKGDQMALPIDLIAQKPHGRQMRQIRGNDIAMIFQEPMTAFSPIHTIGSQMMEGILLHRTRDKKEARAIAIEMLDRVGIANPAQRIDEYSYQLSGGMRQRAMIAMALSCNPSILVADEPTTALDVTVQAQVLALIRELQATLHMAVVYITHDLGVIAETCHRVAVMYLGMIMEETDTVSLFKQPLHPYTRALMDSIPSLHDKTRTRLKTIEGNVPMPIDLPQECPFFPRCGCATPGLCDRGIPPLVEVAPGHKVRCYNVQGGA